MNPSPAPSVGWQDEYMVDPHDALSPLASVTADYHVSTSEPLRGRLSSGSTFSGYSDLANNNINEVPLLLVNPPPRDAKTGRDVGAELGTTAERDTSASLKEDRSLARATQYGLGMCFHINQNGSSVSGPCCLPTKFLTTSVFGPASSA